jgi:hypothetical protein
LALTPHAQVEARIMGTGTLEELERGLRLLPIIQRTMASAERGFHKALTALRQLRKARGFVPQTQELPTQSVSQKHLEAAPAHPTLGFVSQNNHPDTPAEACQPNQPYLEAA